MKPVTFENHLVNIEAGAFCSIEKLLAIEEKNYGKLEILEQTATTCRYKYATPEGFAAKQKAVAQHILKYNT